MSAPPRTHLDAALEAAAKGYYVIINHTINEDGSCSCGSTDPNHKFGKHPIANLMPHGVNDSTRDSGTIREWFSLWPDGNLGIDHEKSGTLAIAPDSPIWARNFRERGLSEKTWGISGGGEGHELHLFRRPADCPATKINRPKEYDILAVGQSIVEPSLHKSGNRYRWITDLPPVDELDVAPQWAVDMLTSRDQKQEARERVTFDDDTNVDDARALYRLIHKRLSLRIRKTIEEGPDSFVAREDGDDSRSGADAAVVAALIAIELTDNQIRGIYRAFPIGRKGKYATRGDDYLAHTIGNERGWFKEQPRATFSENGNHAHAEDVPTADPQPHVAEWPEPPDPVVYQGLAGEIVEIVDPYSEADPIAVLVNTLIAFGNAVGNGPYAMVAATKHTPREYAAIVGRTSAARKGDSWQPPRVIFSEADPDWSLRIASGLSTGEGLIHAVRDRLEKTEPIKEKGVVTGYQQVLADEGISDKRLLVVEPELARVLQVMSRQGNTLSPILRDAWDMGNLQVMTKNNPAKATGAHISLIGHITVDELRRTLPDVEAANGFANRFTWFAVRRSKSIPEPEPFTGAMVRCLADKIGATLVTAARISQMERDDRARRLWRDVYEELTAERDGLAGALLARAAPHVLRWSMIYALMDASPRIRIEHLTAALELWGYAERCVLFIFGDASGDPVADTILAALRANGEMTRTEIYNLFGRHESSSRIGAALTYLLTNEKARTEQRPTGGRPIEVWMAVE